MCVPHEHSLGYAEIYVKRHYFVAFKHTRIFFYLANEASIVNGWWYDSRLLLESVQKVLNIIYNVVQGRRFRKAIQNKLDLCPKGAIVSVKI